MLEELSDLTRAMEQQLAVLAVLHGLAREKTDALVENDVARLAGLVHREEGLVWQLARLEEQRLAAHAAASRALGLEGRQATLSTILERVPEWVDGQRLQADTLRAAGQLAEINRLNQDLLEQAMAYAHYTMQVLAAARSPAAPTYSPNRKGGPRGRPGFLDNRI